MFKGQIIGNLGADAKVKNINGVEYVSFDVAHSYSVDGKEQTIWVSCLARGHAKVVPFLLKGTKVYVVGDLSGKIYDSSVYRCKMIGYSLFVDTLQLCSPKPEQASNSEEGKENENASF